MCQGYLSKYIRSIKFEEYRPRAEETFDDHNRPTVGVINMISNILSDTNDPSPKRQRTEDIISFSENDVKEIQTPRNDAVIVSMMIEKYDIKEFLLVIKVLPMYCSMMLSQK